MKGLRRMIREIHRRSIWQVLAVYLAGSWIALQVVDHLTRAAGMPDWVPAFALVLLILGLPVVLATAIVQEGTGEDAKTPQAPGTDPQSAPAAEPPAEPVAGPAGGSQLVFETESADPGPFHSFLQDHLTWKRAIVGGVLAFALLGFAVTAYFTMRLAGIGPVASLVAQGVLDEREPILLAEFRNATADPLIGSVVTEALRIDLASSQAVALVESAQIRETLGRMEREPDSRLTAELAREVALRDGIKAVLEGEVGAAGRGFILSATLRAAEDGATLATFRRTAAGDDGVIEAIDRLSQDIREKVGESLRSIRQGGALHEVTTGSLDALRRYTEAEQLSDRGDWPGALPLLEEAIALDPEFAMAYRKQAVLLGNLGIDPARQTEAVARAYQHRGRLTELERHLTEALYHDRITGNRDGVIRSYEAALRVAPDNSTALNNLALQYLEMDELEQAHELFHRNFDRPRPRSLHYQNLIGVLVRQGNFEEARAVLTQFEEAYSDDYTVREIGFWVHAFAGEYDAAASKLEGISGAAGVNVVFRLRGEIALAVLDAARGRFNAARARTEAGVRTAAAVDPALEQFYRLASAWLELLGPGDTLRALAALDEAERVAERETLPPRAVDYEGLIQASLAAGDFSGAGARLERWRSAVPANELTSRHRSTQALFEVWARNGATAPRAVLDALDAHTREIRCPSCYVEQRPHLLRELGLAEEEREAWQRIRTSPGDNLHFNLVILPTALERIGELSIELGDAASALDAYRKFVEVWRDADPEQQPRVQRARERIAEIEAIHP